MIWKWNQDATGSAGADTYSRTAGLSKLSGLVAELEQALKADALRAKQDRRTARALFAQIKASGYTGGYTRVTDYIRAWRASAGKDIKAFMPLKFDLGEAFQFDWSEEGMVMGGIYHRMQGCINTLLEQAIALLSANTHRRVPQRSQPRPKYHVKPHPHMAYKG